MMREIRDDSNTYATELRTLGERLAALKATAREADAELKIGIPSQLHELNEKHHHAQETIEELSRTEASKAAAAQQAVEEALTDLRTALDVAETRFE